MDTKQDWITFIDWNTPADTHTHIETKNKYLNHFTILFEIVNRLTNNKAVIQIEILKNIEEYLTVRVFQWNRIIQERRNIHLEIETYGGFYEGRVCLVIIEEDFNFKSKLLLIILILLLLLLFLVEEALSIILRFDPKCWEELLFLLLL